MKCLETKSTRSLATAALLTLAFAIGASLAVSATGAEGLLCNGCSSSSLERAAGVALKGRDTLVMGVVPADPDERASAQIRPLFIVGEKGFGP